MFAFQIAVSIGCRGLLLMYSCSTVKQQLKFTFGSLSCSFSNFSFSDLELFASSRQQWLSILSPFCLFFFARNNNLFCIDYFSAMTLKDTCSILPAMSNYTPTGHFGPGNSHSANRWVDDKCCQRVRQHFSCGGNPDFFPPKICVMLSESWQH